MFVSFPGPEFNAIRQQLGFNYIGRVYRLEMGTGNEFSDCLCSFPESCCPFSPICLLRTSGFWRCPGRSGSCLISSIHQSFLPSIPAWLTVRQTHANYRTLLSGSLHDFQHKPLASVWGNRGTLVMAIPNIRHTCVLPAAFHALGMHRPLRTGHQSLRFNDFHSVSLRKFIYLLGIFPLHIHSRKSEKSSASQRSEWHRWSKIVGYQAPSLTYVTQVHPWFLKA